MAMSLPSRLPDVGTTIFSTMSALAAQHGAVNLGQGFPDFDCDPALIEAVSRAMRAGHNQYPPMPGWPALRQAVARKIAACHGHAYDPDTEITLTAGATGVRREDAPTRAAAPLVGFDRTHRIVKINPLAAWTVEELLDYATEHGVIVNPLLADGYPSIGCEPCTARVAPGEDPRSGRWSGFAKTECGIHL